MHRFALLIFSVFLATAARAQPLPNLIPYNDNGKWGYADSTGRLVILAQWDDAYPFKGDKARVSLGRTYVSVIFCMINKKGEYIIPPEKGWNGQFAGWSMPLNSCDGSKHWGLIDTNSEELIPNRWDAPTAQFGEILRDNFKIVCDAGLYGVVGRDNDLVLPCKYRLITPDSILERKLHAFIIESHNATDLNRRGVADARGKILIKPEYVSVSYKENFEHKGFVVGIADSNHYYASHEKWIEYPSLKEGKMPADDELMKEVKAEGYILFSCETEDDWRKVQEKSQGWEYQMRFPNPLGSFGSNFYGLKNTKGKVLIPCCSIERITADTIFQKSAEEGNDSFFVTHTYLNTKTLQPYSKPLRKWVYDNRRESLPVCGNDHSRHSPGPGFYLDGISTSGFVLDLVFYRSGLYNKYPVKRSSDGKGYRPYDGNDPEWNIIVSGDRDGRSMLINDKLEVLVPPLEIRKGDYLNGVRSYNLKDSLVVDGSSVYNMNGKVYSYSSSNDLLSGAFKWHHKLYVFAQFWTTVPSRYRSVNMYEQGETVTHTKLLNELGHECDGWKNKEVAEQLPEDLLGNGETAFIAGDTLVAESTYRNIVLLDPEGQVLFPELCDKFVQLHYMGNGMFQGVDKAGITKIVNTQGEELFAAKDIQLTQCSWYDSRPGAEEPGLLSVWGKYKSQDYLHFYIDRKGKVYADFGDDQRK